ncbi:hypothetical protein SARC_11276 [Sphaeroforma arctica JP610]|uniref:Iron permease FTR1 n=1 Tax=Sphaeroforma arctica JP610 TaxID=667725 RepID=A0A0L0FHF9_9EUKA|nr:hypothetical protein SARC_11276 [Sphaeroforma arctica JP610]KNC76212.1 hypothetical protein SARC_11276 [Sphaeroforma arctica JP610]|eukprot:XP_014150114.1 hypothetical protein SARC_11276 [Sphaeroforma arctica JP610]
MAVEDVISVELMFILWRESMEASLVISTLLSVITRTTKDEEVAKRNKLVVVFGSSLGFLIAAILGTTFICVFYIYASDLWVSMESLWEGIFSLIASIMLTFAGIGLLGSEGKVERMANKMAVKMEEAAGTGSEPATGLSFDSEATSTAMVKKEKTNKPDPEIAVVGEVDNYDSLPVMRPRSLRQWCDYLIRSPFHKDTQGFFWIPFVTLLRETVEAFVFVAGVGFSASASAVPLSVVIGVILGILVGLVIFFSGQRFPMRYFIMAMMSILLFLGAGLMSKGVGLLESYSWSQAINMDADDAGSGLFDPRTNIWYFDCCNPEDPSNGWWGLLNSVCGWNNIATYGSVISYCVYWVACSMILLFMFYRQKRTSMIPTKTGATDTTSTSERK